MSFKIEITEIFNPVDGTCPPPSVKRFEQLVEHVDIAAIFAAVNKKAPRVRNRKKAAE